MSRLLSTVAVTASLLLPTLLFAASAPDFPAPPEARVQSVSEDASLNGIDMTIRRFEADMAVGRVLRYYRQLWRFGKDDTPGFRENQFGGWDMITRLDGEWFLSVQVQPKGFNQSWGYLSLSKLEPGSKPEKLGKGVPMMSGSRVINDMPSSDPGKQARTLLLANGFSVSSNANYYRNYYLDRGWNVALDIPMNNSLGHALQFQKTGQDIAITVKETGNGSVIVINSVEY